MTKIYHYVFPLVEKFCSKCEKTLPIEAFSVDNHQTTGYRNACKECCKKDRPKPPPRPIVQLPIIFERVCTQCQIEKPIGDFEKDATKCKQCRNKQRQQRIQRQIEAGDVPETRFCPVCEVEKTIDQFYRHRLGQNGYSRECKVCCDARRKGWRKANPEEARRRRQATYNPEIQHQKNHVYYQQNAERMREQGHLYYEANKEAARIKGKQWQQANLLKCRESNDRRRAIKRHATVEKVDYAAILARDAGYCYICEKSILPEDKTNFDHVIPLCLGGKHAFDNIKLTHATCNSRKQHRLLEQMTPFQRRGIR